MKTFALILVSVLAVHCAPLQEPGSSSTPYSTNQKDAQRPQISTLPGTINLPSNSTQQQDGLLLSPSENRPQINQGQGQPQLIGGQAGVLYSNTTAPQEQRPKRETPNNPQAAAASSGDQSRPQIIGGNAGVLPSSPTQAPENQRPKRDSESRNSQDAQVPKSGDNSAQSRPQLIGGDAGVLQTSTTQQPESDRPKRDSESEENAKGVAPLSQPESSQHQGHVVPAVYSSKPQVIGGQAGVLPGATEAQRPKRETGDSKPAVQRPQVLGQQAQVNPSSAPQSNQGNVGGAASNPSVLTRDVPRVKPVTHA